MCRRPAAEFLCLGPWGLPYMTSAVGGGRGVPKKQTKGRKYTDFICDSVKQSENFADVIYGRICIDYCLLSEPNAESAFQHLNVLPRSLDWCFLSRCIGAELLRERAARPSRRLIDRKPSHVVTDNPFLSVVLPRTVLSSTVLYTSCFAVWLKLS